LEPFRDLLIFDWVMALGSTSEAAALLGLPQSSVSRRYRAVSRQFDLPVRRPGGRLTLVDQAGVYRRLTAFAQFFRLQHHRYRWSCHPGLREWMERLRDLQGQALFLPLDARQWEARASFLQLGILDACFDVFDPADGCWSACVGLPLHLRIPEAHPLKAQPLKAMPAAERQAALDPFPVDPGDVPLNAALRCWLADQGLALQGQDREGEALVLSMGPAQHDSINLAYTVQIGWRLAPTPPDVPFRPAFLECATANLFR